MPDKFRFIHISRFMPRRNIMDSYRHHVSGFFAQREAAESALSQLVERGVPRDRLYIFDSGSLPPAPGPKAKSKEVRNEVLVDSAIGTAVGVGLGAMGEVALVAANVSLFVASPLLAPLMMMGWGASLGALIGAAAGAGDKKKFSALIHDAISNDQVVLVVETRTKQETVIASEIIKDSVGDCNDISTL
jgi:hypothetical protein